MSLVRKNIIANLMGSAWVAVISIAFIPLYIYFMGVESYGLVGFYMTLQALFALLDMGMTATVSRELAKLSALHGKVQEMRNLVRTLEAVYWAVALLIMAVVALLSPWIATKWLNANVLSEETIQQAVMLMGIVIALRMPYGFYSGGLLGLQRQVLLNWIKVAVETLKSGGVVFILWLVAPDITAFFLWQAIVTALGLCIMALYLWRCIKDDSHARFQTVVFRDVWRFAAGMSATAVLSVILVQSDKVVLSKLLPLQEFGYYMLASTVAMGLYVIIGPVFSAVYPRFTQLVSSGEEQNLIHLYHKSSQFMTVLVMPAAIACSIFSGDFLLIWTQDVDISNEVAPILSLLVIGTSLNGMMHIPYALQLAYGWTTLAVYMNAVAVIVLIPVLIVAVNEFGAIGGAITWLCLNAGYILFGLALMHKKILTGEMSRWFITDFGAPTVAALGVASVSWWVMPETLMYWQCIGWIGFTVAVSILAALMAAPLIRGEALNRSAKVI